MGASGQKGHFFKTAAAAALLTAAVLSLAASSVCTRAAEKAEEAPAYGPSGQPGHQIDGLQYEKSMALSSASHFSVDYYSAEDGTGEDDLYKYISIAGDGDYLLVPEGGAVPEGLGEDVTILRRPLDSVYLAATSQMDFFDCLDLMENVTLSGLEEDGWYSDRARAAMAAGDMVYAGRYSEPDYETIVARGCSLAIESTMIYHKPQVKEMLARFGIPVMVEHSSYEEQPLGRSEWIRLYGALYDREDLADGQFAQMRQKVQDVQDQVSGRQGQEDGDKPSVAVFSISTAGTATVYKSSGYVPELIRMAGGRYAFDSLEDDTALSTLSIPMEDFYAAGKDADILIYNSTIEGEVRSLAELEGKSSLLKDFKAVKDGQVWCLKGSLFQKPTGIADFLEDLMHVAAGETDAELTFLQPVE